MGTAQARSERGGPRQKAIDVGKGSRRNRGRRTVSHEHYAANHSHTAVAVPASSGTHATATDAAQGPEESRSTAPAAPKAGACDGGQGVGQGRGHLNVLTRMWTGACGFTSLNAKHWSSSWTISAGISLRMILETGRRDRGTTPANHTSRGEHSTAGNTFHPAKRHESSPTEANHPRAARGAANNQRNASFTKRPVSR